MMLVLVAVGVVALLVAAGVGGAAVARVGPFASTKPRGVASASPKPADAALVVSTGQQKHPDFTDVRFDEIRVTTQGSKETSVTSVIAATRNPLAVEEKGTGPNGASDKVTNIATGRSCTSGADGKTTRTSGQPGTASFIDPLLSLTGYANWKFASDEQVNGHADWVAHGEKPPATSSSGRTLSMQNIDVAINPTTNEIERVVIDSKYSDNGGPEAEEKATFGGFLYDSGVTLPPCD
jgi:hypothetical protein